jgi:hypothetical protein
MDLILWIVAGVVLLISLWAVFMAVVGWAATQLFGKSEAWLDYGIEDDDLL